MLSGDIVGLRAIEVEDLPQLLKWRNNPSLRKFFREYRELNSTLQAEWYQNKVLNSPNDIMFSIINLANNRLLGACGLCYIDWINRNADLSLYIGENELYVDKKYANDAAKILLEFGYRELGLHKIYSEIFDFDEEKRDLLLMLNFSFEGRQCDKYWIGGVWHASENYSLLDYEFFNKQ